MLDRSVSINGVELEIAQDLSLSHAGTVWDGALCVISYWNRSPGIAQQLIEGKTVLQLGSGTGILGLCACAFKPKQLFLTDLPEYLEILNKNLEKNRQKLETSGTQLKVESLRWNKADDMKKIGNIDTIIGSELTYDADCTVDLIEMIKFYRSANPKLRVLISFQNYQKQERNLEKQIQSRMFADGKLLKEEKQNRYCIVDKSELEEDFRDDFIKILSI